MEIELKISREQIIEIITVWAESRMPGIRCEEVSLEAWGKSTIYMTDAPLPVQEQEPKQESA